MWHPEDECVAASNRAAFIEWSRATGARPDACPSDITRWKAAEPEEFYTAVRCFAGLAEAPVARTSLLRWRGHRDALVLDGSPPRLWSRDRLRADTPPRIERLMRDIAPAALARLAADHLFGLEIRPRDRMLWIGDPDDPWPLGVWLVGATLLLTDPDHEPHGSAGGTLGGATLAGPTIVLASRPSDANFI
jgi:hypothetical protein